MKKDYDDTFGSIEVKRKIKLNHINERNTANINIGLDYRHLLEELGAEDGTLSHLKDWAINILYKNILLDQIYLQQEQSNNLKSILTIYTTRQLNFG